MRADNAAHDAINRMEQCLDETRQEVARMGDAIADSESTCTWEYDDIEDKWESVCGAAWTFTEGGINENGFKYCYQCGKKIVMENTK